MTKIADVAVVTGSAAGIGAAVARALASRGVRVILVDKDESVHDVAASLRGAESYIANLESEEDLLALTKFVIAEFGGCGILVNNAGINPKTEGRGYRLDEIDTGLWKRVMQVNVTAPFVLCRELIPAMATSGWGRVINIASRAGRTHINGVSAFYSASKAALIGMSRQLAGDYAGAGVTVNCVAPGPVITPLADRSAPEVLERLQSGIPAGRRADAEEVAAAVDFLASRHSAYVCGVALDVNGGGFIG